MGCSSCLKNDKFSEGIIKIAKVTGPKSNNITGVLRENYNKLIEKIRLKNKNIKILDYKLPNIFNNSHYYHNILYAKSLSYYLKNHKWYYQHQHSLTTAVYSVQGLHDT